jgi:hypothetical protein
MIYAYLQMDAFQILIGDRFHITEGLPSVLCIPDVRYFPAVDLKITHAPGRAVD